MPRQIGYDSRAIFHVVKHERGRESVRKDEFILAKSFHRIGSRPRLQSAGEADATFAAII
jgi:hypothetical protein